MLEYLRNKASSFFAKLLLGGIAVLFVLYFVFQNNGGPPMGATAPIAKVNGQNIPSGLYFQAVESQSALFQQLGQGTKTQELKQLMESQILQRLISQMLFSQEAHRWGLSVTDVELAQAIRSNPNFQRDGSFDELLYLKQFKPAYQQQNGQDYEMTLGQDLLQDKFFEVVSAATVVSQNQLNETLQIRNTQIKTLELEVPYGTNIPSAQSSEQAKKLAEEWVSLKKSGQSTESWLKQHGLEEKTSPPQSLAIFQAQYGSPDKLPLLFCLVSQPLGQACDTLSERGGRWLALAPLSRDQQAVSEEQKTGFDKQLHQALQNQLVGEINKVLTRHAKIETFLAP